MKSLANKVEFAYSSIDEAFPPIDCQHKALGEFAIFQVRTPKRITAGGIEIPDEVRETEHYNTQVAKVVHLGPLAFKNRETGEAWPEGPWYAVGDFVRVPLHGGDRWTVKFERKVPERKVGNVIHPAKIEKDEAIFVMFKDREARTAVTGDPLKIKAFI